MSHGDLTQVNVGRIQAPRNSPLAAGHGLVVLTDYQASRANTTTGVAGTAALANSVGEAWANNADVLEEEVFSREGARPVGEVPMQYSVRTNYHSTRARG